MRLDDDLANGQSNAGSGSLGRKERLEDAVAILVRYPDAGVFHRDRNIGRAGHDAGGDRQHGGTAGNGAHRLQRVGDQIQEHLMQLTAIGEYRRKVIVQVRF